ncbi:MAG: DUF2924 domain-containing protein [Pseudorhodoplanes sp.]|nr:DUF2924 domain-containing protein [Pseudorhodoplanes sp.]
MSADTDARIEAEIERIRSMTIAELRALWRAKFKSDLPEAFGPDLLRWSIAQKLQEDAYGGLDRATARLLNELMVQSAKNNGRIVVPRRIKPGAVLVREWKGKSHRITVTEGGFAFEGRPYESLSEIARMITGTRWSGPRFFGLRPDKDRP